MSDIKYMILHTWNKEMIQMYGEKLTRTQSLIGMRSNGLHQELQFTDRYSKISVSATKQDECNCVRFKMINYSHPYRQSRVYIPVTAEQELSIFISAVEMSDARYFRKYPFDEALEVYYNETIAKNGCIFGPDAIKYDTAGVSLSFISKRRWWNPSGERQWCNETCGLLLMAVWPDLFVVDQYYFDTKARIGQIAPGLFIDSYKNIPPHEQTPSQTEHTVRHYFDIKSLKGE